MKEHPLSDWSYSHFANFLVTLTLVKSQVVLVTGVQHHPLGAWVFRAPVVHSL